MLTTVMVKLHAKIIIEMIGKPPEYLISAFDSVVSKINEEREIKILKKTIHEPTQARDTETLFTTFAELEMELDSIQALFWISMNYLPSHIEIITPEKISLSNSELSEIALFLSQKINEYDAIAKKLVYDRDSLLKKLYEVSPELFKNLNQEEVSKIKKEIEEEKKIQKTRKQKNNKK